jgi:hypothetical protein
MNLQFSRASRSSADPNHEPELLKELFHLKRHSVGFNVFVLGALSIFTAYFFAPHSPEAVAVWPEYLKDLGFHLAAAGFVLQVIEPKLQSASHAFMSASIEKAVNRGIEAANIQRIVRRSLIDQEGLHSLHTAATRGAFEDVLSYCFDTEDDDALRLRGSLAVLLQHLYEMQVHEGWATGVFRAFLAEIIHGISENVKTLADLCAEEEASTDRHGITLFSPAKRTDLILSSLMKSLEPGSRYSVISDLGTWRKKKLDAFFLSSAEAIERGVFIRRLFVIGPKEFDNSVTPDEVFEILKKHVVISQKYRNASNGYRVRLLDDSRTVGGERVQVDGVDSKHHGIFTVPDHPLSIKVTVDESDLSQLFFSNISNVPGDSVDLNRFEEAWRNAAPDLDLRLLRRALKRWNEARRTREV